MTWYVLILVETQKSEKQGERLGKAAQKSVTSEVSPRNFCFSDTGKLLMLEDEALGLGELELLSDSTGLPLLGRELLCFQLGLL